MPLLKLETTVDLTEDKRKALLASLSKTVAETIGKAEQCVMVSLACARFHPGSDAVPAPPSYSTSGARHRLLGLGLVEDLDPQRQLFRIRGVPADRFTDYLTTPLLDDLVETALRLEALE